MKRITLTLCQFLVAGLVAAQELPSNTMDLPKEYFDQIRVAKSQQVNKDYRKAATEFTKAFSMNGGKGRIVDRYNAACSWSLASEPDSAFYHLQKIENQYANYDHILQDTDLSLLHNDQRWELLMTKIRQNKERLKQKQESNKSSNR